MAEVLRDPYKSVVIDKGDNSVTIAEGDTICFTSVQGELVQGLVTKLTGKGGKTKIQLNPFGSDKEEIWLVVSMDEIEKIDPSMSFE